jgi:hypothetical protein
MKFKSEVQLEALNNATTDTDRFLVSDSGTVKYRTGAQVLSDLGVSGIYVPYTGATGNVDLGTHTLLAKDLIINHSSGSGVAASITKNGSGEALTVIKGSGSGNAMSVTGGLTSLVNLSLSTVANAIGDFLTHSGSTIHKRTPAQVLSDIGGQAALTNPITGIGTTNYVSKFTGATSLGDSQLFDNGSGVGIGTTSPNGLLHLYKNNSPVVFRLQSASPYAYPGDFSIQTGGYGSNDFIIYDNTASAERLYINSSGNVGIGTTSPSSKLSLFDSSDLWINISRGSSFVNIGVDATGTFYNTNSNHRFLYNAGSNEAMRILSNGNVGIGTTSPAKKLDIYASASDIAYFRSNYSGNAQQLLLSSAGSGITLQSQGYLSSTSSSLLLNPSGGNVGIGTTSPSNPLTIRKDANSYLLDGLKIERDPSTTSTAIFNAFGGATNIISNSGATSVFSPITFRSSDGTTTTEIVRFTGSGNVGIGTTAPIHKLSVNGKIGGDVYADSFVQFTATTETIVSADGNVVLGYAQNVVVDNEGSLGVGTIAPEVCAAVDITSTTQGFLPPRMTTSERDAIGSPVNGLMIWNTDNRQLEVYAVGTWLGLATV